MLATKKGQARKSTEIQQSQTDANQQYQRYKERNKMPILTPLNSRSNQQATNEQADPDHDPDTDEIVVLDRFKVGAWLFDIVQRHVEAILPYLIEGSGPYTWQELLGEDFMADMTIPSQLPLLCLQHIAQQPDSKLTVMPMTGNGTTYFEFH